MLWRELRTYLRHLPADSAFRRALHGADVEWGLTEQLLAAAVDALHVANWQRSADGAKGRNQPKQIPRPGVKDPTETQKFGTPRTIQEIDAMLALAKEKHGSPQDETVRPRRRRSRQTDP